MELNLVQSLVANLWETLVVILGSIFPGNVELMLYALIMGVVEGLTEFIPVSSTGHMILVGELLPFSPTEEVAESFEVFIQLGAILAAVIYYRQRFFSLFKFDMSKFNFLHVLLGMIPAGLLGFFFYDTIKSLFGVKTVCIALIVGGIFMILAEKYNEKIEVTATNLDELSYGQAFKIGCFQILSLWPGFSRSGSTIAGGLIVGTDHRTAADYTFILAVPMMLSATVFDLLQMDKALTQEEITMFAIGFITAFIVALFAITTFVKLLKKLKLAPFAYYRFVVAILFWIFVIR